VSGTGAGAICRDYDLLYGAHFKTNPFVFCDIIQFATGQLGVKIDFSLAIQVIERRNVRFSGSVAGGQAALSLSGKKFAGVVFTHPENGHSGQASTIEFTLTL
jgi:hypothetical protein